MQMLKARVYADGWFLKLTRINRREKFISTQINAGLFDGVWLVEASDTMRINFDQTQPSSWWKDSWNTSELVA
jgi:hypothetical protein